MQIQIDLLRQWSIHRLVDDMFKEPQSTFEEISQKADAMLRKNEFHPGKLLFEGSLYSLKSYSSWAANYLRELGRDGKGAKFILSQTAMAAMNPQLGMGKIYNPASVIGPPPGGGGIVTKFGDVVPESNPGSTIARNQDRLRAIYEGRFVDPAAPQNGVQLRDAQGRTVEQVRSTLNAANEKKTMTENVFIDFDGGAGDTEKTDEKTLDSTGVVTFVPDYDKIFKRNSAGPQLFSKTEGDRGHLFYAPNSDLFKARSQDGNKRVAALNNFDSFFSQNDQLTGYIDSEIESFDDDYYYIPFSFTDLRKQEISIYFRAFLDSVSETISPNYSKDTYYGRTDPVSTYQNTERSFNISFKIAALSQQGLSTMWRKIANFVKMLYPTKVNGQLKQAPLVRVRLGDLFCTSAGLGIPGRIEQVNFDYNSFPWEIARYSGEIGKIVQVCQLSFTFSVIHDKDIFVSEDYVINSSVIRRLGSETSEDFSG